MTEQSQAQIHHFKWDATPYEDALHELEWLLGLGHASPELLSDVVELFDSPEKPLVVSRGYNEISPTDGTCVTTVVFEPSDGLVDLLTAARTIPVDFRITG